MDQDSLPRLLLLKLATYDSVVDVDLNLDLQLTIELIYLKEESLTLAPEPLYSPLSTRRQKPLNLCRIGLLRCLLILDY